MRNTIKHKKKASKRESEKKKKSKTKPLSISVLLKDVKSSSFMWFDVLCECTECILSVAPARGTCEHKHGNIC